MLAVMKMLVRLAEREEEREKKLGLKPKLSAEYWEEAFRIWREMVLKKQCSA